MKLKNLFLPLLVGGVFALASCDEADTNSDMPRFSGFEYEVPVVAGDTLTVVAKQSQLGKLIGSATYDWVCLYDWTNEEEGTSGQLDTLEHQFKKVYYSIDSSDPQFKFFVPENASRLVITFTAEYNYAGQGPNRFDGSTGGSGTGGNGYIRPVTSNNLFGRSKGSVTIQGRNIVKK